MELTEENWKIVGHKIGYEDVDFSDVDIDNPWNTNTFTVGRETWLFLNYKEADEYCKDSIIDSLWAFKPSFLASKTNLSQVVFEKLAELCEDANEAVKAIIESSCGLSSFYEAAIVANGRGHFISTYDGEEIAVDINGEECYLYRVD